MPIAMSSKITEPSIEEMPKVRWSVAVTSNADELDYESAAKCDNLDEAVELAASLAKRYFVLILSEPVEQRIH